MPGNQAINPQPDDSHVIDKYAMVESDGIIKSRCKELRKIIDIIDKNHNYYSTNPTIKGPLDFLKLVIDNCFYIV